MYILTVADANHSRVRSCAVREGSGTGEAEFPRIISHSGCIRSNHAE
jgi:hypothetical protein